MALEHDQQVNPVNSLGHVESPSSVGERVDRKKEKRRKQRREKAFSKGDGLEPEEELSDELSGDEQEVLSGEEHVDFRA